MNDGGALSTDPDIRCIATDLHAASAPKYGSLGRNVGVRRASAANQPLGERCIQ